MHRLAVSIAVCSALVAMLPRTGETDEPATVRDQIGLLGEPPGAGGHGHLHLWRRRRVRALGTVYLHVHARRAAAPSQGHDACELRRAHGVQHWHQLWNGGGVRGGGGPGMASAGAVGAVFSLVACALTLLTMRIDRRRG